MDEDTIYKRWLEVFAKDSARIQMAGDQFPKTRSWVIDYADINDVDLQDALLDDPEKVLRIGESAIHSYLSPDQKVYLNLRIANLYPSCEVPISSIESLHVSKYVMVAGMVDKVTEIRPTLLTGTFTCSSCGFRQEILQDSFKFIEPLDCPKDDGGCGKKAGSTTFVFNIKESVFVNRQKIRLLEMIENIEGTRQPQKLTVYLEDDICNTVSPGDEVVINGSISLKQRREDGAKSTEMNIFFRGNYIDNSSDRDLVEISPEDIETFHKVFKVNALDKLTRSFAPSINGLDHIKKKLIIQLVGGVRRITASGTWIRGDIHVMIIGDPGTAKSQLALYCCNLVPGAVFTEARSATEGGIIALVEKDKEFGEGKFTLTAGAMVKAHKRLLVYDDAHRAKAEVMNEMLGPMERQRKAINKGGINTTVKTEEPVLIIANPKNGRFTLEDMRRALIDCIDTKIFTAPFMDRIDIVLRMYNIPKEDDIRSMIQHMLNDMRGEVRGDIEFDLIKKYLYYCRHNFAPEIPPDLDKHIIDWVIKEMNLTGNVEWDKDRQTVFNRHINSIFRMSQACAKLRMSSEVNEDDVRTALELLKESLTTLTSEDGVSIDFEASLTGEGRSMKQNRQLLYELVADLAQDGPVDLAEIIDACHKEKIDNVEDHLSKLKDEGRLYCPRYEQWDVI